MVLSVFHSRPRPSCGDLSSSYTKIASREKWQQQANHSPSNTILCTGIQNVWFMHRLHISYASDLLRFLHFIQIYYPFKSVSVLSTRLSSLEPLITTSTPRLAKAWAHASPTPLVDPVTNAVLFELAISLCAAKHIQRLSYLKHVFQLFLLVCNSWVASTIIYWTKCIR